MSNYDYTCELCQNTFTDPHPLDEALRIASNEYAEHLKEAKLPDSTPMVTVCDDCYKIAMTHKYGNFCHPHHRKDSTCIG